jgi:Skp family chaperone for outer membrane proteins
MTINTKEGLVVASIVALYSAAFAQPTAIACETLEELDWEFADADAHRIALQGELEALEEKLATVKKDIVRLDRELREAIRASDSRSGTRSSIAQIERSLKFAYEEMRALVSQHTAVDQELSLILDKLEDIAARIHEAEVRAEVEEDGFFLCPCESGADSCSVFTVAVLYCATDGETQTEVPLWAGCLPCGGDYIGFYFGRCE